MSATFCIGYEWLPGDDGDAAEQSTLAALAINVGESCATEVEDIFAKTVRFSARLSARCLAEWFAINWWRLLWEPKAYNYSWRTSHKIGNAGKGYVWPDLAFASDWQSVMVSSCPTKRWEAEPIRYLNRFDIPVPLGDFERGVDNFIEGTIARLSSIGKGQSDLSALWDEVSRERRHPEVSEWRSLEACMGYDPDEGPYDILNGLRKLKDAYGASAVQEMAATSKERAISHLSDLWDAAQESDVTIYVPGCDNIRQKLTTESNPLGPPWRRATQAARVAREIWGLEPPIHTDKLCDLFHITEKQLSESLPNNQKSLIAGVRDQDISDAFRIVWNSNRPTTRRFALARLAADHIVTPDRERLLPGTRSATHRQKFQRAFAQELLCPVDVLTEHLDTEILSSDDIDDAAQHFGVSPHTVQMVLVNKGIIDRETVTDWIYEI